MYSHFMYSARRALKAKAIILNEQYLSNTNIYRFNKKSQQSICHVIGGWSTW